MGHLWVIPAGPPLGSALVEKSEVVIRNFFLPFLFIRIGLLTDIFSIKDWKAFVSLGMILVAAYLGKVWGSQGHGLKQVPEMISYSAAS